MRRRTSEGSTGKKIITLQNPEIIDGYIKDLAAINDSSDSAIIEDLLLGHILSKSDVASYYIRMLYSQNLKKTYMGLMQDLSAGIRFKAAHTNAYELIRLGMNVLDRPFTSNIEAEYEYLRDEHFVSNCCAVRKKLEYEKENLIDSFNSSMRLQDDIELLKQSEKKGDNGEMIVTFVPYNYFLIVLNYWSVLSDYTFTYRLLFDVVAMSENRLWTNPEDRVNARNIIDKVCGEWQEY